VRFVSGSPVIVTVMGRGTVMTPRRQSGSIFAVDTCLREVVLVGIVQIHTRIEGFVIYLWRKSRFMQFRPMKLWELLVIHKGELIAALDWKSHVGPRRQQLQQSRRGSHRNGTTFGLPTARTFLAYAAPAG
jgi:hypothetical protein